MVGRVAVCVKCVLSGPRGNRAQTFLSLGSNAPAWDVPQHRPHSQATGGLNFPGDSALSFRSPGKDLDLLLSEFWSRRLPQDWTPGPGTFILVRRCLSQGTPSIRLSVSGGPLWGCHSSRHRGPTEPSSANRPPHPSTRQLLSGQAPPREACWGLVHSNSSSVFLSLPWAACGDGLQSLQPPLPCLSTLSLLGSGHTILSRCPTVCVGPVLTSPGVGSTQRLRKQPQRGPVWRMGHWSVSGKSEAKLPSCAQTHRGVIDSPAPACVLFLKFVQKQ